MTAFAFFNLLQLIGGVILSVGYIPQIIKIVKTKSVRDFSRVYLTGVFVGIVFMEAYALYMYFVMGQAGAFLLTNSVSFLLSGTEFFLVNLYWNRERRMKAKA